MLLVSSHPAYDTQFCNHLSRRSLPCLPIPAFIRPATARLVNGADTATKNPGRPLVEDGPAARKRLLAETAYFFMNPLT